jgi:hypothetical protein
MPDEEMIRCPTCYEDVPELTNVCLRCDYIVCDNCWRDEHNCCFRCVEEAISQGDRRMT